MSEIVKAFFIQYKFILPKTTNHSSYTYQKLFRAIYGYTQNVTKANGKTYRYHRKGVLSDYPYIRAGKNSVIIPPEAFGILGEFFNTGKNPTHNWEGKGDWKAVYYLDEKTIDKKTAAKAVEDMISKDRVYDPELDIKELDRGISHFASETSISDENKPHIDFLLSESNLILNSEWFKQSYTISTKLTKFFNDVKSLKRSNQ